VTQLGYLQTARDDLPDIELHRPCALKQSFTVDVFQCGGPVRLITDFVFLILFFVLLAVWLIVWAAMHVAGGGVHLLIALAVIFLIIHFFRRRRVA